MALDETKKCDCGCNCGTSGNGTTASSSKQIIYYKLKSPYYEDYTKNCGLVGSEIDQNFFNLKEMDIIGADWDSINREIVLTRVDGVELRVKGILDTLSADWNKLDFKYNAGSGVLTIVTPTETFELTGFFTEAQLAMANDETLTGDGNISNPLGVSPIAQTGTYKPVNNVIEEKEDETIEVTLNKTNPVKGDRYVTIEYISRFGKLYPYGKNEKEGIQKLIKDLKENASEWRVPSKTDWDVMLTCVEGCVKKDVLWHDSLDSNEDLGFVAGQRLKTKDVWEKNPIQPIGDNFEENYTYTTEGTDTVGFSVLPVGYGDENGNPSMGFGKYTAFWSSTKEDKKDDMYTKRFYYNDNRVFQGTTEPTERLSLRLVKTYNGKNFANSEVISGMTYPCQVVRVPSDMKGTMIYSADEKKDVNLYATVWTTINVGFSNPDYLPKQNIIDNEWNGKEEIDGSDKPRYFINDWDGNEWKKHELHEGESIVIKEEYDGVRMHEWRLIDGILVDTVAFIKGEIQGEFEERLTEVKEELEGKIQDEATLRETVDNQLRDAIKQEAELRKNVDNQLLAAIRNEAEVRANVDKQLREGINQEAELRKDADEQILKAVQDEGELRKNADKELEEAIKNEASLRESADEQILKAVQDEAELRKNVDDQLLEAIKNEASLRETVDNQLRDAIRQEAELRKNVDNQLLEAIRNEGVIRKNNDIDPKDGYVFTVNGGILETYGVDVKDIKISLDFDFGELPEYTPNNVTE